MMYSSSQSASSSSDSDQAEDEDERLIQRVIKQNDKKMPLWGKNMFLRRGLRYRRLRYKQSLQQQKKRDWDSYLW